MKHSIAQKLFFIILGLFFLVFTIQWLFISFFFQNIYLNSIMDSHQSEFSNAVLSFSGGDADSVNSYLRRYAAETNSSILVITQDYQFGDRQFMDNMGAVSLSTADNCEIRLPTIAYQDRQDGPVFYPGDTLLLHAVRLGNSQYYEPLILSFRRSAYTNLQGVHNYGNTRSPSSNTQFHSPEMLRDYVKVQEGLYFLRNSDQHDADYFLYQQIRDCLVYKLPLEEYLSTLSRRPISDGQTDYAIYVDSKTIDETTYYFLTARQIIITGQEEIYLNQMFYVIYLLLGIILVFAAWFLSRYVSKPLIYLSNITQRLTQLDFSQQAQLKRSDELGLLADRINLMASSLHATLQELQDAEERARRNEERMQKLLADLAHEFKTPLFIISSYAEALEKGIAGGNSTRYYAFISSEIDQLSELVNEVIELSRIQMGTWRVNIESWDIRDVIQAIMEKFENRFCCEGFSASWSADDVMVWMDVRRIEQVLTNLLSNAIKYSNQEKRIEISTCLYGDTLTVLVGNSGELSDSDRERIWERYYRHEGSDLSRLPSEGIGLDIVKTILQAHNSKYGVRQENDMVFFYFTLGVDRSEME